MVVAVVLWILLLSCDCCSVDTNVAWGCGCWSVAVVLWFWLLSCNSFPVTVAVVLLSCGCGCCHDDVVM